MSSTIESPTFPGSEDENVRAIVLEIDSPGGEVTASDVIYNAVVRARAKKPVVVYMDSLAASGGYYVACGGRYLMASDTTITGSIGVIIQTLNYEQLFNKVGLASVVFKSGKFKDMLNGARPITPEEREYVQSFVMGTYEKFLGIVAKERSLPADALRNTIADGRILSGRDAHDHKLIDGLGQMEDAFKKAKELGNAFDATVVKYGPPFALGRILRALGESSRAKLELTLPKQLGGAERDAEFQADSRQSCSQRRRTRLLRQPRRTPPGQRPRLQLS
jgi:protease-4